MFDKIKAALFSPITFPSQQNQTLKKLVEKAELVEKEEKSLPAIAEEKQLKSDLQGMTEDAIAYSDYLNKKGRTLRKQKNAMLEDIAKKDQRLAELEIELLATLDTDPFDLSQEEEVEPVRVSVSIPVEGEDKVETRKSISIPVEGSNKPKPPVEVQIEWEEVPAGDGTYVVVEPELHTPVQPTWAYSVVEEAPTTAVEWEVKPEVVDDRWDYDSW